MRTRIAPTPSGFLHAGNAIDILLIDMIARRQGAQVLLRIDDLDADRVRPEYVQDVFDSLEWLGVQWHEGPRNAQELEKEWSQHFRLANYAELLGQLRDLGVLYGCTCTRGTVRMVNGKYAGTCRDKAIDLDEPSAAWRIAVPLGTRVTLRSPDGVSTEMLVAESIGDVVLRQRADHGRVPMPAYQIASLADDVRFGIDVIVRGEDLLPSSALQFHLAQLLDMRSFLQARFIHHPLILDEKGNKLSKSEGAFALRTMRQNGIPADGLRSSANELCDRYFPSR